MSMTFEEKSLWVRLAAMLIAYGVFFQLLSETAWGPSAPADLQAQQVALFMGTTLLLILILAESTQIVARLVLYRRGS